MHTVISRRKPDLLLALTFIFLCTLISYYYPVAQLTWDSYYYLRQMIHTEPNIRPNGYPVLLKVLYVLRSSFKLIVWTQFLIYFVSIMYLLKVLSNRFYMKNWQYYLLGVLLLAEPVALYHCMNVLSDVLFSALSLLYVATLIQYLDNRKTKYLLIHIALMYAAIEVRHIALFYPVFSFVIIVIMLRKLRETVLAGVLIFGVYAVLYKYHLWQNEKKYGVSVYSAFSGWTHTNNVLYGFNDLKKKDMNIEDPEIRNMHQFFKGYLDTANFNPGQIGSGFLWDDKSPMCVMRQKLQDSAKMEYLDAWFALAPGFAKYGTYMQRKYPGVYVDNYMIPNLQTLWSPHDGEMASYYVMRDADSFLLAIYGKKQSDMVCRQDIYNQRVNGINNNLYKVRLVLFALSIPLLLLFWRRLRVFQWRPAVIIVLFTGAFYLLTLYSSWFMQRYLLPVIPLMTAFIFLSILVALRRREKAGSTTV